MSDQKNVTIKISLQDGHYQLTKLNNNHDDNPDNDFWEVILEGGGDRYISDVPLKRNEMHFFSLIANGRKNSDLLVEIPELDIKQPYTLNQWGVFAKEISIPVFQFS